MLVTITVFITPQEYRVYQRVSDHHLLASLMSPRHIELAIAGPDPQLERLILRKSLTSTVIGSDCEITFDGLAIALASAIVRCGAESSAVRLIVLDNRALPKSLGEAQLTAIAALIGVVEFAFLQFPFFRDEGSATRASDPLALTDQAILVLSHDGLRLQTDSDALLESMEPVAKSFNLLGMEVERAIGQELVMHGQRNANRDSWRSNLQVLTKSVACRLLDVGDYKATIEVDTQSGLGNIPVSIVGSARCHKATESFVAAVRVFSNNHPVSVVCLEEAYLSVLVGNVSITNLLDLADLAIGRGVTALPNWTLGLKLKNSFRGGANITDRFDMEAKLLVLDTSQSRQDVPVLLPSEIIDENHLKVCCATPHGESIVRIPLSKTAYANRNIACYIKSVKRTSFAEIFDFHSTITEAERLVLCYSTGELVALRHGSAVRELSNGFLSS